MKNKHIALMAACACLAMAPATAQARDHHHHKHNEGLHLAAGIVNLVGKVFSWGKPTVVVTQPTVVVPSQPTVVVPSQTPVVVVTPQTHVDRPSYYLPDAHPRHPPVPKKINRHHPKGNHRGGGRHR